MSARGFLSYVHSDNAAEGGRIVQLATDVRDQYQLLTAEKVELVVDEAELRWGEDWRVRLDELLQTAVFIIPVITPSFFSSVECRRELQEFTRNAEQLGVQDLILPILYVDVPELRNEETPDDAVRLVRRYQWQDWTELRFEDSSSPAYRKAVALLATRIRDINGRLVVRLTSSENLTDDFKIVLKSEEGGTMDKLAELERALPEWSATMIEISQIVENVGNLAESATTEFERSDAEEKGFVGRVHEGRKFAASLESPVARLVELANLWAVHLYVIDTGYRVLLERLPTEVEEDPAARPAVETFLSQVEELVRASDDSLGSTEELVKVIRPLISLSRDLKPRFRDLQQGLTVLVEGRQVIRGWLSLADEVRVATNLNSQPENAGQPTAL